MRLLFLSFALALSVPALAFADEISTSDIYVGKELSFCGKVESVSSSGGPVAGESYRAVSFSVKRDDAVFHLEFVLKKDAGKAPFLKSGAILRAKGVCRDFSVSDPDPKFKDDKRQRVEMRMEGSSVEPSGSEPEGFVCKDAKNSGASAETAESKDSEPSPASSQAKGSASVQRKKSKEPASSAPSSSRAFDEAEALRSIVTVEGEKGKGSAFVANLDGRKFLVTNIHVIFDNAPKFLSVSNDSVEVKPPLLSSDRDIALYELKEPDKFPALELAEDVVAIPSEEPVIVFGNSMGAGVNTRLKGNVKGVGPTTIEISAKIVPGNSGSPIIDAKTGKVVGVSTYGTSKIKAGFLTKGTRFEDVRRFGTRVDNLRLDSMEPFDARKYAADLKLSEEAVSLNELGYALLSDIYSGKNGKLNLYLSPSKYDFAKRPGLERLVNDWNSSLRNGWSESIPGLLKRMRETVSIPDALRKQKAFYSWTRGSMERQVETNDSYAKAIDDLRKEIEEALKK